MDNNIDQTAMQKLLDIRKAIEENNSNTPALHRQICDASFIGLYNNELMQKIKEQADKISLHGDQNSSQNFIDAKREIVKIIDDIIQGVYKFN